MLKQLSILRIASVFFCLSTLLFSGCNKERAEGLNSDRIRIVLQTDWFPQPEHGGFYQALAKGFYEEAGLNVEILPGGPNSMSTQKVLKGKAHFAMNRADTIYTLTRKGVPVQMVMASLQHDPQALMLHAGNPIGSFAALDGQRVMAIPGLAWITWLEAKYGIQLDIIPHDFGIERFLNDPAFIQQCLLTNEPFYALQSGVDVKVLPLRESGFDPYHGIYCLQSFAKENPEVVRRFVEASIRGWKDFIKGDPAPALSMIAERNPKMNAAFMEFSYEAMKKEFLVTGKIAGNSRVGWLDPDRMTQLVMEMQRLGLAPKSSSAEEEWYTTQFLLRLSDAPVNALP